MNEYRHYMDRQKVSADLHDKLLYLGDTAAYKRRQSGREYLKFAAAVVTVLVIGIGFWRFTDLGVPKQETGRSDENNREFASEPVLDKQTEKLPEETEIASENSEHLEKVDSEQAANASEPDDTAFVAQGPVAGWRMHRGLIFANYTDVTGSPETDTAALKAPEGSFSRALGKDEITRIFWGESGKPAVDDPKEDMGDFPLCLAGWTDYKISGDVCYDGSGDLWRLVIRGIKGKYSFEMVICPGQLPPDCGNYPDLETKDVLGTKVTGWSRSFDCDGDGQDEYLFGAKLMAGDYGAAFVNIGSGSLINDKDPETSAMILNAMTVDQLVRDGGGLYLDHLLHTDDIPAWRNEEFETLEDALAEKEYAAYLPVEAPAGYEAFRGHLNYQAGRDSRLRVGWSNGYDDVEVEVHLQEGDSNLIFEDSLVDAAVPASYDWRLYDGPICDTVPEQYQLHFYNVTFRAADMSQELVKARMCPHDTGGEICIFNVLHENGVVVSYRCAGVSADYVWGLVEKTLEE